MATRNATSNFTFEQWRVEFNELATDVGDISAGITGSVPSGASTYTTVENALEALVTDVNNIINGTHDFTGNASFGGNVDITGNLTIGGLITIGDNAASDRITVNATLESDLIPEATNAKDIGSSTKSWRNIYIGTEATLASAKVSDLSSGRLILIGTDGALQDNANLTYSGSNNGDLTITIPKISVGVEATLQNVKISSLSGGKIPITGTDGFITENANLGWTGTALTSTNIISTSIESGQIKLNGSPTSGIITTNANDQLESNTNLTFDGSTLAVTGAATISTTLGVTQTLNVTGDATFGDDVTVTDNLVVSGTGQSTSSTTGAVTVAGGAGVVKDLYVGGSIVAGSNISIAGSTPFSTEGFSIAMSVALG